MDTHELAARDALAIIEAHEMDAPAAEDALKAVVDALPGARPFLLDCAETRLEFLASIELDPKRRQALEEALAHVRMVMEVKP